MKKNVWLPVILLACAAILASSCGKETEDPGKKDPAGSGDGQATDPVYHDNVPEGTDFGGKTVNFYSGVYNGMSANFVDGENGETLNDTRLKCEQLVENRLNVVIEENRTETPGDPGAAEENFKTLYRAGDTTYDIVTNMDRLILWDMEEGYFYPLEDIEYVDLTAEYWNPEMTAQFAVGGKIMFALSSFNLYSYANTAAIFMNRRLADALDIEVPWQLVKDGKWTYEKMLEYAALALDDLNGDGSYSGETDQFGFFEQNAKNMWINHVVASGCNQEILHKNEADYFEFGVTDKYYDVLEQSIELFRNTPYGCFYGEKDIFIDDRALFCENTMNSFGGLRNVDFNYTVLPTPKYDENQDRYFCRTYDSHISLVPKSCVNMEEAGAVLEALSSAAYQTVLPAYIETTLQDKYCNDEESKEMMRLILDSRTLSLAEMHLFNLFGNAPIHNALIAGNQNGPASYIGSIQTGSENEIARINEGFRKLLEDEF